MNFKSFKETIEKVNEIAIFTHVNPDGDTLGSGYALYYGLKEIGKTTKRRFRIFVFSTY